MYIHIHLHVHMDMHMQHSTCTNLSYKCIHTYTSIITHAHTHTPLICIRPDISCVNVIHTLDASYKAHIYLQDIYIVLVRGHCTGASSPHNTSKA